MPVASPPTTFGSTKSQTVPEPANWMTSGPRRAEVAEPPKQRCPYPRWQPNDSRDPGHQASRLRSPHKF